MLVNMPLDVNVKGKGSALFSMAQINALVTFSLSLTCVLQHIAEMSRKVVANDS